MLWACCTQYFVLILFIILEIFVQIIDGKNRTVDPRSAMNHTRMFGGSSARIDQHPFVVQLEYHFRDMDEIQFMNCGGSIISSNIVITAGHCIVDSIQISGSSIPVDAYIRAGTELKGADGVVIRVEEYLIHPGYNEILNGGLRIPMFDVALLKLEIPFQFYCESCFHAQYKIAPIRIATENDNIEGGTRCDVAGWGMIGSKVPTTTSILQHTNMTILPQEKCERIFRNYETWKPEILLRQATHVERPVAPIEINPKHVHDMFNQMICASYQLDQRSPCYGDAGGPLIAKKKLHGIVSWGVDCYDPRYASVFVRLTYPDIYKWIKLSMAKLHPKVMFNDPHNSKYVFYVEESSYSTYNDYYDY